MAPQPIVKGNAGLASPSHNLATEGGELEEYFADKWEHRQQHQEIMATSNGSQVGTSLPTRVHGKQSLSHGAGDSSSLLETLVYWATWAAGWALYKHPGLEVIFPWAREPLIPPRATREPGLMKFLYPLGGASRHQCNPQWN